MKSKKSLIIALIVTAVIVIATTITLIILLKPDTPTPPPDVPDTPDTPDTPTVPETVYLFKDGTTKYSIVYSDDGIKHYDYASEIFRYVTMQYVYDGMQRYEYNKNSSEFEILIGATDRQISKELVAAVNAANKSGNDFVWGYCYKDGQLAFYANSEKALELGWQTFFDTVIHKDGIYCLDNLYEIGFKDYDEYIKEQKRDEEAKKNELRKSIRTQISKFNVIDFGELPKFPVYGAVPTIRPLVDADSNSNPPKGIHPRVFVNEKYLKDVIANLEAEENSANYKIVKDKADAALNESGELAPNDNGNFKVNSLATIESLAFMYLVTGEDLYGYSAILHAFNFIDTVKFSTEREYQDQFIPSGSALMILAEVYDWCYDLFLPAQRENFVIGAVNNIAVLMEFGFPPKESSINGVVGHATGTTILRNSLAFAIAVADEFPQIYNCLVSMILEYYVEPANFYYKSGTNFQGSNYGSTKTEVHVYSDLLMYYATGERIYDVSFEDVMVSFLYRIRPDGESIRVGDDYKGSESSYGGPAIHRPAAFLAYACYGNTYARAWYQSMGSTELGWDGEATLTPVFFLIFNNPNINPPAEHRYDLDLVSYTNDPSTMLIVRSAWGDVGSKDNDAWLTYTNMEAAFAGNHDHKDAGTFQIYYKGILAPDSGQYQHLYYANIDQAYGNGYDSGYVKSTISKNGLLIYNPDMESVRKNYSGGQTNSVKANYVITSMNSWRENGTIDQTEVLGKSHLCDDDGNVVYAYISGDITKAYEDETVDLVMRSTMTLATGDPDHPMAFIVYDRIKSDKASYKKTFVLHTMEEPTFAGGTKTEPTETDAFTYVTGTNSFYYTNTKGAAGYYKEDDPNDKYNGKLTLTTLLPAQDDLVYSYVGGDGKRFWVNGVNLGIEGSTEGKITGLNGKEVDAKDLLASYPVSEIGWGRVEVSPKTEKLEDSFLNVMLVSDADNTEYVPSTLVEGSNHKGAMVYDNVVMFSTTNELLAETVTLKAEGTGKKTYYIGGMSEGRWEILVDGNILNNGNKNYYEVGNAEGMLTFEADAGKEITIIPRFEKLNLIMNGGAFTEYIPAMYYPGELYTLPTDQITERYSYSFQGWYETPDFSGERIYEIPADATGVKTYYAKWIKEFGVITYELNGGTFDGVLQKENRRGEALTLPDSLAKPGCTFLGWYKDPDFNGEQIETIPENDAEDWHLYAKYEGPDFYMEQNQQYTGYFITDAKFGDRLTSNDGVFTLRIDTSAENNQGWHESGEGGIRLFNSLINVDGVTGKAHIYLVSFKNNRMVTNKGTPLISMNSGDVVDIVADCKNKTLTYYVNGILIAEEKSGISGTFATDFVYYNCPSQDFDPSQYQKDATGPIQLTNNAKRVLAYDSLSIFYGAEPTVQAEGYHKLTLDTSGGESSAAIPAGYYTAKGYTLPTGEVMSKLGYTFAGWFDSEDNEVTEIPEGTEGALTYYAKWTKVFGIITYYLNGGKFNDGVAVSYENHEGQSFELPNSDVISKLNCDFMGWYTSPDYSGEAVTATPSDGIEDIEYYARYKGPAYTIAAGKGTSIYPITKDKFGDMLKSSDANGIFTLHIDTAAEGNYGWHTNEGGLRLFNSIQDKEGTGGKSHVWLFKFDGNTMVTIDGELLITMNSGDAVDIIVNCNNKKLTYYVNGELKHEVTVTEANGTFAADLMYYNCSGAGFDETLYRRETSGPIQLIGNPDRMLAWDEMIIYLGANIPAEPSDDYNQLTFELDGGSTSQPLHAGYYTADGYKLPDKDKMSKHGYEFLGWFENENGTGTPITEIAVGISGDKILYAKWTKVFGVMTYKLNGGVYDKTLPVDNKPGEVLNIPTEGFTKAGGCTFLGWYDNPEFNGNPITSYPETDSADHILYAKWSGPAYYSNTTSPMQNFYALSGVQFGSMLKADGSGKFTVHIDTADSGNSAWGNTSGMRLVNPTSSSVEGKGSQIFIFNFKNDKMVTHLNKELITMNSGDVVDIIVSITERKLYYYVNGTFKCEEAVTVSHAHLNIFPTDLTMYDAYYDGMGEIYSSNGYAGALQFTNDIETFRKMACDEFAVYVGEKTPQKPEGYNTLTINAGGATVNAPVSSGYYTAKGYILPTAADMTYRGYTFAGWYDNAQFNGEAVAEIAIGTEGDKTYYAKWEANFGTIEYELDGGAYDGTLPTVNYGDELVELPLTGITKDGFVFVGWYDNALFTGEPIKSFAIGDKSTVKLYARYVASVYSSANRGYTSSSNILTGVGFGTQLSEAGGLFTLRLDTKDADNLLWDSTADNGVVFQNPLRSKGGAETYALYLVSFKGGNIVTNAGAVLAAMNSGDLVDVVVNCINETITYYVNGTLKCTEALAEGSIADDLKLYNGKNYSGVDTNVYDKRTDASAPIRLVIASGNTVKLDEISVYIDDIVSGVSK